MPIYMGRREKPIYASVGPPPGDCVAIPFCHCEPFEYLRVNSLSGARQSLPFPKSDEIASVLPPMRESLAMTSSQRFRWERMKVRRLF